MTYREKVEEAARYIQKSFSETPEAVMVLGSGLGGVAEAVENQVVLSYGEIPHWPASTAPGHSGRLVCGRLEGRWVIVMQGRAHYYEGYSMEEVTFPRAGFWSSGGKKSCAYQRFRGGQSGIASGGFGGPLRPHQSSRQEPPHGTQRGELGAPLLRCGEYLPQRTPGTSGSSVPGDRGAS